MDEIRYRGRVFTGREIEEIREVILTHRDRSRWFISRELCRRWQWVQPNGVPKDIICRGFLLHLARQGLIELPPCRRETPYRLAHAKKPIQIQIDQTPIEDKLSDLRPVELLQVRRTPLQKLYSSLIEQYHYLGYTRPVGEHLEYLAFSHGLVLACLGWCSAPRHIGCRDRYLGWTPEQRVNNLCRVVINTRFLILPWVNAYNKAPVQIQYCYAHLLRDVEKIEKDFPDSPEVKSFVSLLAPLLSQAMHLRSQPLSDEQYCREAKEIQKKLIEIIEGPAQHLAIRAMQDLFRTHEHRLYHWVQDRQVPPDNNLAERDLRPTVIARKVSFGSSSDAGSKTRSILMSVLHTLNKRRKDQSLESILKNLLDEIAKNPTVQIASLFPLPKSITRN